MNTFSLTIGCVFTCGYFISDKSRPHTSGLNNWLQLKHVVIIQWKAFIYLLTQIQMLTFNRLDSVRGKYQEKTVTVTGILK